ncbi:3'-5' exonuclease [Streptomyces sp. H49]|uniref:3'-5' exonuclease n=1 Tax=Streptomyces sp. H49 TaxID=3444117 RepID=UPI003F4A8A43
MSEQPRIAFVDCETTHLDAEIGEAWEVAVILRTETDGRPTDREFVWQFAIDETAADPKSLRIGRYHERHLVDPEWGAAWTGPGPVLPCSRASAVEAIASVLAGAVLVGSNPGFDERFLRKLLGPGSARWHYRPYDIVQLAAAKIGVQAAGPLPWSSHALSQAVGIEPPTADAAHTALGDARWARDVFDAVMAQEKFPMSWEGRAQHAIGLYTRTAIELEDAHRELRSARAAISRARKLASQWAVLRTHGSAATDLRAALDGPS